MKKIKHKLPKFIDINTFDFTPYGRELTREEAYLVNGGVEIENSIAAQALANPGDTVTDSNGNTSVLTEYDIKWAQEQIGYNEPTGDVSDTSEVIETTPVQTNQCELSKKEEEIKGQNENSGNTTVKKTDDPSQSGNNNDNASTSLIFDPHDPTRIIANLDDPESLKAAAELLSDPFLGYTVTAYGEETGKIKNFKNYSEIYVYLSMNDKTSVFQDFFDRLMRFHFEERDSRNIITESYQDILESAQNNGDWKLLSPEMSKYHQNGFGFDELKFVCKDGREAVFTKDFSPDGSYELYLDPRYKGTYNYCDPINNPIGHFFKDMVPYYLTGFRNERTQ